MSQETERLLVVVAHGDDETLGAGGTIARLVERGVTASLCVLTSDDSSRAYDGVNATTRIPAIEAAAATLGIKYVNIHRFGDSRLDTIGQLELNRVVEREVRDFQPDTVFTTSLADLSLDHQLVSRAARIASRAGRSDVHQLRCFEVRSSTDCGEASGITPAFRPNCWQTLDASHLDVKLDALRAYGKEVEDWPSPRSEHGVRVLAEYRGSQVYAPLAEAFEVVRTVLS